MQCRRLEGFAMPHAPSLKLSYVSTIALAIQTSGHLRLPLEPQQSSDEELQGYRTESSFLVERFPQRPVADAVRVSLSPG